MCQTTSFVYSMSEPNNLHKFSPSKLLLLMIVAMYYVHPKVQITSNFYFDFFRICIFMRYYCVHVYMCPMLIIVSDQNMCIVSVYICTYVIDQCT